jgi:hypothetical protein
MCDIANGFGVVLLRTETSLLLMLLLLLLLLVMVWVSVRLNPPWCRGHTVVLFVGAPPPHSTSACYTRAWLYIR